LWNKYIIISLSKQKIINIYVQMSKIKAVACQPGAGLLNGAITENSCAEHGYEDGHNH
jgi:hypothetical protein